MDMKTKGNLIEEFANVANDLILARKEVEQKTARLEMLTNLISLDNELSEMIMAGGISTVNSELITLNTVTHKLEIKKCVISYTIKSELTADQLEVLENGK